MELGPLVTIGATAGTMVLLLAGAPAVLCFGLAVVSAVAACREMDVVDQRQYPKAQ